MNILFCGLYLNDLKTAFERNAHVDVGIDKITTYRQLENELQYYSDLLKTATASERTEIQKQINALNALRDKWDETLDELKKPEDISRLDTIDSLDKAISYYEGKQKKASAAEISDIARTISALEKKRDSLKQLARLPDAAPDEVHPIFKRVGEYHCGVCDEKVNFTERQIGIWQEIRCALDPAAKTE